MKSKDSYLVEKEEPDTNGFVLSLDTLAEDVGSESRHSKDFSDGSAHKIEAELLYHIKDVCVGLLGPYKLPYK